MPDTFPPDFSAPRPLAGKTALVTGAAKRIGRRIALTMAAAGANVAITYLGSQSEAEDTVGELAANGVEAFAVRTDLNDPESHVSRLSRAPRGSKLLEDLGTLPKITYLEKQTQV